MWALQALVDAPFGDDLTFKGGTSLSKAYRAIRRFSEDLDITFDIRTIAADLVADNDVEVIPSTRNQERRWSRNKTAARPTHVSPPGGWQPSSDQVARSSGD